jgi:four helix bundle protein
MEKNMETYNVETFNQRMRERTELFSIAVYRTLRAIRLDDLNRIVVKQLVKSSSSVAANYSSATRGRSEAEFYSKLCIVVEECDETLFWLRFMILTEILSTEKGDPLKNEADELLRIFSSIKKKLKLKQKKLVKKQ